MWHLLQTLKVKATGEPVILLGYQNEILSKKQPFRIVTNNALGKVHKFKGNELTEWIWNGNVNPGKYIIGRYLGILPKKEWKNHVPDLSVVPINHYLTKVA